MLTEDQGWYYLNRVQWEENLAFAYDRNGLTELAMLWFHKAYIKYRETDPRVTFNYAMRLHEYGNPQGVELLKWLTINFPEYPHSFEVLNSLIVKP
jgi:hypothetical protein